MEYIKIPTPDNWLPSRAMAYFWSLIEISPFDSHSMYVSPHIPASQDAHARMKRFLTKMEIGFVANDKTRTIRVRKRTIEFITPVEE